MSTDLCCILAQCFLVTIVYASGDSQCITIVAKNIARMLSNRVHIVSTF